MKDTKKILRHAVFNALTGAISYGGSNVPVSDEKTRSTNTANLFILLCTQTEEAVENNDSVWITKSGIELEIIQKSASEVSKDAIDDVYEDILEILLPTTSTIGLTVPSGFQFLNAGREFCITQNVELSPTESVLVCRFKLTFTIVQQ